MKRIKLNPDKFFDKISLLDDYEGGPVPESCIFLAIGTYYVYPSNKTRKEVEYFGIKNYINETSTIVISDSEESFLFNFFENGDQADFDLFNIYTYKEISAFYNYIKKDIKYDLPRKNFMKNIFSGEKVMHDQLYYLIKSENIKERMISRIIYDEDTVDEKDKILEDLVNKGYLVTTILNTNFILDIFLKMKKAKDGNSDYYPDFYYPNPLIYYSQIKEELNNISFDKYLSDVQKDELEVFDEDGEDSLLRIKLLKE